MQTNSNQGQGSNQNNQQGGQQKSTLSWSQPTNTQGNKPQQQSQPSRPLPPTVPASSGSNTPWVIAGVIIVIALIVWGFNSGRNTGDQQGAENATSTNSVATETTSSTTPSTSDTTATTDNTSGAAATTATTPTTAGTIAGLTIPSPQTAGMQVAVAAVDVSTPTWVVVYEDNNGVPGNVLGAGLFTSSNKSGVVELLRGTLPGQTYFVGESRDDGDRMYSMTNDPATRDQSGNPVLTTFQTK